MQPFDEACRVNPEIMAALSPGSDENHDVFSVSGSTYVLALAITVAVAIKVMASLLITAMLIIPAATARVFSRRPEVLAGLAMVIAGGSVIGGTEASYRLDTPTGPTIVCLVAILFTLSVSRSALVRHR
jgi:ABC-type Mn2+/Zn2+ transport system permease subunit